MIRPWRITEAVAAASGGVLTLLGGFVSLAEGAAVLGGEWNVYGFFLGLLTISALSDQGGL